MDATIKLHLGRPLLTGPMAVEATLVDGSTFRLMFGNEDWFEDEGFSILAMREGEEKLRMVFLRYDTIARVEAFEPAEGRMGFQMAEKK